jgi:antitoxin MazE
LYIHTKMEIPVITIGNSKGIRLPKSILEQYDIKESLEIILEKGRIILKPSSMPRKGWEKAFRSMHENGDDQLLIDDVFSDEDFEEWK